MSHLARALVVVATLGLPVGAAAQAQPSAPDPAVQIMTWVEQVLATGATPGMAVAVVKGDSVLLAHGFGVADAATGQPATDSTRFYIASTTKAFTALAAAILDQRGVLRLDAPLSALLPAARLHEGLSANAITLRDLLGMRNGIDDGPVVLRTAYTGEFTTPELIALLREHPPARTGRAFRYSNIGFNVAGLVLERRFSRPWRDVVREQVLDPLGMRSTSALVSSVPTYHLAMPHDFVDGRLARIPLLKGDRTMHAAGGHFTTAGDLARFLVAQMNAGRVRGQRGVPAAAIAETHRRTVEQDRQFSFVRRTGWGLGWDIATYDGMTLYQRNGGFSGYYSHLSFIPERGIGVAVTANGALDAAASEMVAQGVYDLLLGRRDLAALARDRDSLVAQVARLQARSRERSAAVVALPLPPARYFGTFRNASIGTLTLEGNTSTLVVRLGDSWGLARGATAAGSTAAADAIVANVLGGEQRFTLRFAPNGGPLQSVALRNFVFDRVGGALIPSRSP
jgi:CubicO group peptidase (beta-lactamase class C family)